MGSGGRVLQLAADTMTVGELDGNSDGVLYEYPPDFDVNSPSGIFALRGVKGCWRCGDPNHLRNHCKHPPSAAELQGLPMNQWAKYPEAQPGINGSRSPVPINNTLSLVFKALSDLAGGRGSGRVTAYPCSSGQSH